MVKILRHYINDLLDDRDGARCGPRVQQQQVLMRDCMCGTVTCPSIDLEIGGLKTCNVVRFQRKKVVFTFHIKEVGIDVSFVFFIALTASRSHLVPMIF